MELSTKYLNLDDADSCNDIFKDHPIAGLPIADDDIVCNSTPSEAEPAANKTYDGNFSVDLSMDSIQGHIDISSAILPRSPETVGIAGSQDPVYPDLIFVSDDTAPDHPIDLNNIQLYLECSDDSENPVVSSSFDSGCEMLSQTGTSLLKSDVRLKISFPVFPEERDKGFRCSLCKEIFKLDGDLRSHILKEHQNDICMCPLCSYNTKSKKFFETHMKAKHKQLLENSELSDGHILLTYSNMQTTNSSIDGNRTQGLSVMCADSLSVDDAVGMQGCNEVASVLPESHEVLHLQTDTASLNHMPNTVNLAETFELVGQAVDVHETRQVGDKNLQNKGKTVCQENNAITELFDSNQFACQSCALVTKSSKLLKMHYANTHDKHRILYKCTKCSYTCKQKRSFVSHIDLHEGALKFQCEICLKKFVSKPMFTRHKKTHIEDRKHVCVAVNCEKAFKTKGALTDHRKKVHDIRRPDVRDGILFSTHTNDKSTCTSTDAEGDRSETCTIKSLLSQNDLDEMNPNVFNVMSPDYSGYSASTLAGPQAEIKQRIRFNKYTACGVTDNVARRYKSPEAKSFKCSYPNCNKVFRDNFNLRNHMCVHDGMKHLSCAHCDFVCVQRNSLNYHYKSKHAGLQNDTD